MQRFLTRPRPAVRSKAAERLLIGTHSCPFVATSQLSDKHDCDLPPVVNVLRCRNRLLHICSLAHAHSCTLCHMVSALKHRTPRADCDLCSRTEGISAPLLPQSKMCRAHANDFPEATGSNAEARQQIPTKRSDTMKFSGTVNKRQISPLIPVLPPLETLCDS